MSCIKDQFKVNRVFLPLQLRVPLCRDNEIHCYFAYVSFILRCNCLCSVVLGISFQEEIFQVLYTIYSFENSEMFI